MTNNEIDYDVEHYPCSCGHCNQCGINFVATPEEERRWAREDEEWTPKPKFELVDGEWHRVW